SASPMSLARIAHRPQENMASRVHSNQGGMAVNLQKFRLQVPVKFQTLWFCSASFSSVFASAVVHEVRRLDGFWFCKVWRFKRALNRQCPTLASGLLRLEHDLEDVISVRRRDSRRRAGAQTFEQIPQSICPGPVGSGLLEELPAAG